MQAGQERSAQLRALRRRLERLQGGLGAPGPEGEAPPPGHLADLRGRLVELDGGGARGAALTFAAACLREAQLAGEPTAWIAAGASTFFPPDLLAWGIDLRALPVVRAGVARRAFLAADRLLRSGAFGLVVLDLEGGGALPLPVQSRLSGLALRHRAALLLLASRRPEEGSLGSLTSLRLACAWRRAGPRFLCRATALKDKRRGPGWSREIDVDGPPGLR